MSTPSSDGGLVLGNKLYDKIKFVVQIVIPAVITLYTFMGTTWHWPDVKEVVGTLGAIGLFLGSVSHVSSANFSPPPVTGTPVGNFTITEHPDGKKIVTLGELNQDPADFVNGDVISFHVDKQTAPSESEDDRGQNLP